MPEELVWTVVYQVGSALLHMLTAGLPYTPLALDNIFLLRDRLALENMLSRKHRWESFLARRGFFPGESWPFHAENN